MCISKFSWALLQNINPKRYSDALYLKEANDQVFTGIHESIALDRISIRKRCYLACSSVMIRIILQISSVFH